jgi:hypothetical protein
LVLEMADRYGLSFVLVVPFVEGAQQFLELAQQAGELYREQPSWLRMPGLGSDEPRPVVLLRMPVEMELDLDAWRPVLSGLDLTVVVESTDPVWIEAGADGLMFGRMEDGYRWASGLPEQALYVPMVSPGFSEEWAGGGAIDRGAGQF